MKISYFINRQIMNVIIAQVLVPIFNGKDFKIDEINFKIIKNYKVYFFKNKFKLMNNNILKK